MSYTTLALDIADNVAHIRLNRPKEYNSMTLPFWQEMVDVFREIEARPEARVVVVSSEGKHFTSGLDLSAFQGLMQEMTEGDPGRVREQLYRTILELQETMSVLEKCRVPVLVAIQGGCIGGGVDLVTAGDMRYCTENAFFQIQEINIGMTADVGTLQRLPKLIGMGMTKELAFTGRRFLAQEAKTHGLVNEVYENAEAMLEGVFEIAKTIASKSPLSVVGTKEVLHYARDHSIEDGLKQVATWNAGMIFSSDIMEAAKAGATKSQPVFKDTLAPKKLVK